MLSGKVRTINNGIRNSLCNCGQIKSLFWLCHDSVLAVDVAIKPSKRLEVNF